MKRIVNVTVPASACDSASTLSLLGYFSYIEDAVTELMGDLAIDGLTTLKKYNALWVFTRHRVKLHTPLVWRQPFTLTAAITAHSAVRIDIDVIFTDKDGQKAAEARSQLCAVDLASGHPAKISAVGVRENMMEAPLAEIHFSRPTGEAGELLEKVKVRSMSIDYGHHTNNIEYLRFLFNSYTAEELAAHTVKEVQIDFFSQSFAGDELSIYRTVSENTHSFTVKKEDQLVIHCDIIK